MATSPPDSLSVDGEGEDRGRGSHHLTNNYQLTNSNRVNNKNNSHPILLRFKEMRQELPASLLPSSAEIVLATEDGSAGHKGMVSDLLPEYAPSADQIFACGPLPMLRYMAIGQKKLDIKNKPSQISLEMRMGCGVGVCYGCTIRTKNGLKQVCKDGPVFSLGEVIWDDFTRC